MVAKKKAAPMTLAPTVVDADGEEWKITFVRLTTRQMMGIEMARRNPDDAEWLELFVEVVASGEAPDGTVIADPMDLPIDVLMAAWPAHPFLSRA